MKRFLSVFFVLLLGLVLSISCFAYTVTPYADLTSSSGTANNLIDLYRNESDYDPLQEFAVFRESQYVYTLFYGSKLSESFKYIRFTQAHNTLPQSYSFGSGSNLQINDNGYLFTGNIPGSVRSDRADSYFFRFIVILGVTFIVLILIFKTFHRRANMAPAKGFTIK